MKEHYRKKKGRRRKRGHRRWKVPERTEKRQPAIQQVLFHDISEKPFIIERPDHNISRQNIDREALKVLYRLKDHNFTAYLVGGSVRDLQLGKKPKDFDVGTDATPEQIKKVFRHSRIIGKRFRLVHVYFKGGKIIEVSTFRKKIDMADTEAVNEGFTDHEMFGHPREDALRRDITINGLFYNIADFSIIDYVGGMDDLNAGLIRTIGDPERRFLRDPVRMMRVIRHAARTGFRIDQQTWDAVVKHADKIRLCSIPRVRDEWLKDMRTGVSADWCRLMIKCGLFQSIFQSYSKLPTDDNSSSMTRDLLIGLFEFLDLYVNKYHQVHESMILSVLAYPLLIGMDAWKRLHSDRIRWATHEIRTLTSNMFHPYDFGRYSRELMSQIIASQNPIEVCMKKKSWPKRVCSKDFFSDALEFFNACQGLNGEPQVTDAPNMGRGPHKKKKTGRYKPFHRRQRKR